MFVKMPKLSQKFWPDTTIQMHKYTITFLKFPRLKLQNDSVHVGGQLNEFLSHVIDHVWQRKVKNWVHDLCTTTSDIKQDQRHDSNPVIITWFTSKRKRMCLQIFYRVWGRIGGAACYVTIV